eukprot:CAMPEP_0116911634 /NCGR_PEP_ID=MMETSP0467-20121206/15602_1 /TAXON_ID=283647 /ORGANISM="Mesodinium pulex, Strain SPMC105" /LENGTH=137 /DNA_ID=CAMNT_0004587449 /DNA_START=6 /DNA_END=419 /DNA_ORIENTATION=+
MGCNLILPKTNDDETEFNKNPSNNSNENVSLKPNLNRKTVKSSSVMPSDNSLNMLTINHQSVRNRPGKMGKSKSSQDEGMQDNIYQTVYEFKDLGEDVVDVSDLKKANLQSVVDQGEDTMDFFVAKMKKDGTYFDKE